MRSAIDISIFNLTMYAKGWNCTYLKILLASVEFPREGFPYTNVLLILIIDMIRISILSEKHIKKMLKFVSRLYLVKPNDIKLRLTIRMK